MPLGFILPALQLGLGLGNAVGGLINGRNAATNAANELSTAGIDAANTIEAGGRQDASNIQTTSDNAALNTEMAGNAAAGSLEAAGAQGRTDILAALQNLDPYSEAGRAALQRLMAGLESDGEFARAFNGTDFRNDAGLEFRTRWGSNAIQNSAIARTGAVGGNLGRALIDYNQGAASDEYDRAFNRFMANRRATLEPLQGLVTGGAQANNQILQGSEALARLGTDTATNAGRFRTDAAQAGGQFRVAGANNAATLLGRSREVGAGYRTDAASARAAGIAGRGNAWQNFFGNAGRAVSQNLPALMAPRLGGGFGGYAAATPGTYSTGEVPFDLGS